MAKDTEKLIRQLSLISFLMAQGRPVSALEIKREVEGYSDMNDDAFARRFYADRAELESLGIELGVEKPGGRLAPAARCGALVSITVAREFPLTAIAQPSGPAVDDPLTPRTRRRSRSHRACSQCDPALAR